MSGSSGSEPPAEPPAKFRRTAAKSAALKPETEVKPEVVVEDHCPEVDGCRYARLWFVIEERRKAEKARLDRIREAAAQKRTQAAAASTGELLAEGAAAFRSFTCAEEAEEQRARIAAEAKTKRATELHAELVGAESSSPADSLHASASPAETAPGAPEGSALTPTELETGTQLGIDDVLRQQLLNAQQDLEAKTSALAAAQAANGNLQLQLSEAEAKATDNTVQLKRMSEVWREWQEEAFAYRDKWKDMEDAAAELAESNRKMEEARQQLPVSSNEQASLLECIDQLKHELIECNENNVATKLRSENASLNQQLATSVAKSAELADEISSLLAQHEPKQYFERQAAEMVRAGEITLSEEQAMITGWERKHLEEQAVQEQQANLAAEAKAEKQNTKHASYMRYYRGLNNRKRCNPELAEKIRKGGGVYDLWLECQEDWAAVDVAYENSITNSTKDFALENYKTKDQLLDIYKNTGIVDAIIDDKKKRGGHWVMAHPEAPHLPEATLYLVWGGAGTEKTKETQKSLRVRGDVSLDTEDEPTRSVIASLMDAAELNAAVHSRPAGPSKAVLMEEAQQEAVAALKAERTSELEAAQRERERKKKEAEAKKTPADKMRAELAKLSTLISGKLRQLQAAEVAIKELPVDSEEAKQYQELSESQHSALKKTLVGIKSDVDGVIALGARATVDVMTEKHTACSARLNDVAAQLKRLCAMVVPTRAPRGKISAKRGAKAPREA